MRGRAPPPHAPHPVQPEELGQGQADPERERGRRPAHAARRARAARGRRRRARALPGGREPEARCHHCADGETLRWFDITQYVYC